MKKANCFDNTDITFNSRILRGARVTSPEELEALLMERQQQRNLSAQTGDCESPRLQIGGLTIPPYLENLGFFYVGSPGSGKSQTIFSNIKTLLQRDDFRMVIVDRNGEILERSYDPDKFILFNPRDMRSVLWSHRTEQVDFDMLANSLIPANNSQEQFWPESAKRLLSSIYSVAQTNSEVYQLLNKSTEELADLIPDHEWLRDSEKTASCVLATAKAYLNFYKYLPDEGEPFSF